MKNRRWVSREARLLCTMTGDDDPTVAIGRLAAELVDEAQLNEPPFDPVILASFRNAHVRRRPMTSAARLFPESGALIIEVNQDHSPGKQNFSIDHEVTHTLLPTYTHRRVVDDRVTGEFSSVSEEELLCDIGASCLLLDQRWLVPLARDTGPSLHSLFSLAERFGASLQATARKICELDVWPCAIVFWEEGYRKHERVHEGQGLLPIFDEFGVPRPKLRTRSPYWSASFGHYVPVNKSVEPDSMVAQCLASGEANHGVDVFDLGRSRIRLYCENASVPYRADGTLRQRVVSILLRTEPRTTLPPAQYQFEME